MMTNETKEDKGNAIVNRMVRTAVNRMVKQMITKEEQKDVLWLS